MINYIYAFCLIFIIVNSFVYIIFYYGGNAVLNKKKTNLSEASKMKLCLIRILSTVIISLIIYIVMYFGNKWIIHPVLLPYEMGHWGWVLIVFVMPGPFLELYVLYRGQKMERVHRQDCPEEFSKERTAVDGIDPVTKGPTLGDYFKRKTNTSQESMRGYFDDRQKRGGASLRIIGLIAALAFIAAAAWLMQN